jgi:hypothetical protein
VLAPILSPFSLHTSLPLQGVPHSRTILQDVRALAALQELAVDNGSDVRPRFKSDERWSEPERMSEPELQALTALVFIASMPRRCSAPRTEQAATCAVLTVAGCLPTWLRCACAAMRSTACCGSQCAPNVQLLFMCV